MEYETLNYLHVYFIITVSCHSSAVYILVDLFDTVIVMLQHLRMRQQRL